MFALGVGFNTAVQAHGDGAKKTNAALTSPGTATMSAADRDLAQRVVAAINADKTFRTSAITVNVTDGEVQLIGSVPGQPLADKAERIAKNVAGVNRVSNNLTVQSG